MIQTTVRLPYAPYYRHPSEEGSGAYREDRTLARQDSARIARHLFLVDPVVLALLPGLDLALLEPESNLLLGVFDGVGAVADVAADILLHLLASLLEATPAYDVGHKRLCTYDGEVTTDGARLGGERVGGTEDLAASLDGITALPDHGADGAAAHVGDQAREEGLLGEVGIVLLEVLLGGGGELDGGKLEATALEAGDDGSNEAALGIGSALSSRSRSGRVGSVGSGKSEEGMDGAYLDAVRLDSDEAVHRLVSVRAAELLIGTHTFAR